MNYLFANLDICWVFFCSKWHKGRQFHRKNESEKVTILLKRSQNFQHCGRCCFNLVSNLIVTKSHWYTLRVGRVVETSETMREIQKFTFFIFQNAVKKIKNTEIPCQIIANFLWLFFFIFWEDDRLPKCIFELLSLFLFHTWILIILNSSYSYQFLGTPPIPGMYTYRIVASSNVHYYLGN